MRSLRALLAALAVVTCVARVEAYPSYDNGSGVGCVSCHPGFTGGPSTGVLHQLHTQTFSIGSNCTLCHQTTPGEKPVLTYWSSGVSGLTTGYGCSGCHGSLYGETIPTGFVHAGDPKSTSYGLRAKHALEGVTVCGTCHVPGALGESDPAPAIHPETFLPPYYQTSTNNLFNPCDTAQESFDGTIGLDNDGNGDADYFGYAPDSIPPDSACQGFVPPTTTTTTTTTSTTLPSGAPKRITVYPGQSIQDAVDAVAPGGTISVMPGTYQETHLGPNAITVNKSGIKLLARSRSGSKVILQPFGLQKNGIVVEGTANARIDGSRIKGFTIQGFPNNGILTRYLDNFKIEKNESIGNLENGIWPTLSANGLVKKNVAYGSEDSALWIEASENVRAIGNELYDSPTGLEITVSNNIVAKKNVVHDNVTGIGLYNFRGAGLPALDPPDLNGFWDISNNHVYNNNKVNTVTSGLVAGLPSGGGILVAGVDNVNIERNLIENNDFYGISVVDWCLAVSCPTVPPGNPPALDGVADNNTFVRNTLTNNGTNPQPGDDPLLQLFALFAADITYAADPNALPVNNCFSGNTYGTLKSLTSPPPTQVQSCK